MIFDGCFNTQNTLSLVLGICWPNFSSTVRSIALAKTKGLWFGVVVNGRSVQARSWNLNRMCCYLVMKCLVIVDFGEMRVISISKCNHARDN